jgi:cell division protease FtsH
MTLGGRAAEEIVFGKISTGALSDLERITKMAYSMVTVYGMNDKIGNISFYDSKQSEYNFNKPYSESTSQTIDNEVRKIIADAYERTKKLLKDKLNELEIVAQKLLEKEIIFQSDLETLIGKRPFEKETTYQAYTNRKVSGDGAVDLNIHHPSEKDETKEKEDKIKSNGEESKVSGNDKDLNKDESQ